MDQIPDRMDSKFRYVLLAARRAEQLMQGARPKVVGTENKKISRIALSEVEADVIEWDYGPAEEDLPAEQEVIAEEVVEEA